jgi:hypothetical protein
MREERGEECGDEMSGEERGEERVNEVREEKRVESGERREESPLPFLLLSFLFLLSLFPPFFVIFAPPSWGPFPQPE